MLYHQYLIWLFWAIIIFSYILLIALFIESKIKKIKHPTIKVTKLEGYYATGDWECFCFDKYDGPIEHNEACCDADGNYQYLETRVYPSILLPDNVDGKKGTWTITVEFEPDENK